MAGLWIVVLTNMAIGLASGEVSIRYAAWWLQLRRLGRGSGEPFAAAPVILGVSIVNAAFCGIVVEWFIIRSSPVNARLPGMTDNDLFLEIFRLVLFTGLCFMTWPVSKISYRHSRERALAEMIVRLFLILVSLLFGFGCATIYHCQVLGAC